MGAVDLMVDVAGVDEEDVVGALAVAFAFVEEPERAREGDGVEEVGADRDHYVDDARFDQVAANLLLGGAGVAGRVRHDETGAAIFVEAL